MDMKKVLGAVGAGVILVGAGIMGGLAIDNHATVTKIVTVEKQVPIVTEKIVKVPVDRIVEKEVIVNNTVEDESFLKLVCDRMMYDDIQECKEEVNAEDNALTKALDLINDESELFDFLEDEGMICDEDEARLIKVYDDFEDVVIVESDFDDESYVFDVKVRVHDEDADVKSKMILRISVDEDEVSFEEVNLA